MKNNAKTEVLSRFELENGDVVVVYREMYFGHRVAVVYEKDSGKTIAVGFS